MSTSSARDNPLWSRQRAGDGRPSVCCVHVHVCRASPLCSAAVKALETEEEEMHTVDRGGCEKKRKIMNERSAEGPWILAWFLCRYFGLNVLLQPGLRMDKPGLNLDWNWTRSELKLDLK